MAHYHHMARFGMALLAQVSCPLLQVCHVEKVGIIDVCRRHQRRQHQTQNLRPLRKILRGVRKLWRLQREVNNMSEGLLKKRGKRV